MVNLRFVPDDDLNGIIVDFIDLLKSELIDSINPSTIILSGSFGKGEVTAIWGENITFLSDCEIIVLPIHIHLLKKKQIDEIRRKFYAKTNISLSISGFHFGIKLLAYKYLNLPIQPTMELYDIKYGSKTIYGFDYLEYLPDFVRGSVPHWEGIRLILNRMAESVNYVSRSEGEKEDMIYWTDKVLLACQDALLIINDHYNESYKKRNEIFAEFFPESLPELCQEIPDFPSLTSDATYRKLCGSSYSGNQEEYWFRVLAICDKVLRYIIFNEMGFEFKDYIDFQQKYIKCVCNYVCTNRLELLRQNACITVKSVLVKRNLCTNVILKPFTPWRHVAYSMIPLLYFSQTQGFSVKKEYLDHIREIALKECNLVSPAECRYFEKSNNPYDSFEKDIVVSLWEQYC